MQPPTQRSPPCSHDTSHRAECYKGSFTSSPIESSSGLIVKEVDSGIRGNGSDCKWQYADNTGKQSKGSISRCTATLDTDARLIPPPNDTPCAITNGHKCLLNRWSLKRKCDTISDEEREEQELDLTNSGVVTKYKAVAETVNTESQLVLPECKPKAKIVDLGEIAYSFNREQTWYMYKKVRKIERGITSPTCISVTSTVGKTYLENIASLSPSRLSAKHGSCAFDPGGSTSQNFARDWKKIEANVQWVLPQVKIIGVEPFDANAMALLLHLDRRVELDQAGGFVDGGAVMVIDEETFRLCSKELTEGMGLVSHSAICASLNDMFEGIGSIFKLSLAGAETYCKYYGLKGTNVVAVTSGADMNFSRLRLIIAPEDVVQLYRQLSSQGMETHEHQELLELFHDSQISELHYLLASWFAP